VLAIGDALCHFIPVFGKGMSVAAQEAVILDRLLAEDVPMKRLASLPSKAPSRRRGVLPSPISCTPPRVALARPTSRSACNTGMALPKFTAQDPEVHQLTAEVSQLLKPQAVLRDPALADVTGEAAWAVITRP
jgi:hypothetical protein